MLKYSNRGISSCIPIFILHSRENSGNMRGRRGRTGEGYGSKKMILVKIAFIWKNKKQIIRQESLIERM
jgi:hypothetical protein